MNFQPKKLAFRACGLLITFFVRFFMCFSVRIQVFRLRRLLIKGSLFEEETGFWVSTEWCHVCYQWSSSLPTCVLRFNSNVLSYFLFTVISSMIFFLIIWSDPCLDARPFHSFKRCICPMIPLLLLVASEWQ